mgnify:CR=1 FL=1
MVADPFCQPPRKIGGLNGAARRLKAMGCGWACGLIMTGILVTRVSRTCRWSAAVRYWAAAMGDG